VYVSQLFAAGGAKGTLSEAAWHSALELPVTGRGVSIILFALLAATPERDLPFQT
jgi:hypothetical protein